jgi:hypothetical protein
MDLGVKILYMMFFNKSISVSSVHHELARMSPVFYYLEKHGIDFSKFNA